LQQKRPHQWEGDADCQSLQFWICYPNTAPSGQIPKAMVLPSVLNQGGVIASPGGLVPFATIVNGNYWNATTDSNGVLKFTTWSPIPTDIISGPAGSVGANGEVHVCMLVNSYGTNGKGLPVGLKNVDPTDPFGVDPSAQSTAAQRNFAIVPGNTKISFPFLSGVRDPQLGQKIEVSVRWIRQDDAIDPNISELLRRNGYSTASLRPARRPLARFGLAANPYALNNPWISEIFSDQKIAFDNSEIGLDRLFSDAELTDGPSLEQAISFICPPCGIYPAMFLADPTYESNPGDVHIFDISQNQFPVSKAGGIRLIVVVGK
jgi:hypothetical protein